MKLKSEIPEILLESGTEIMQTVSEGFYGCVPAASATQHDEIDIELVTNLLQPGGYANEPLGAVN